MNDLELITTELAKHIPTFSLLLSTLSVSIAIFFFVKSSKQVSASASTTSLVGEFVSITSSKAQVFNDMRELKVNIATAQRIISDLTSSDRRDTLVEDIKQMSASFSHLQDVDNWYEQRIQSVSKELKKHMSEAVVGEEKKMWDNFQEQDQGESTRYVFHKTPLFIAMIYEMVEEHLKQEMPKAINTVVDNQKLMGKAFEKIIEPVNNQADLIKGIVDLLTVMDSEPPSWMKIRN